MANAQFGDILRDRRKTKQMTQEQLALEADLSVRYIQALEANQKSPSLESTFRLSNALGTTPGKLLDPVWREWKKLAAFR